jgi:hypothetical protein
MESRVAALESAVDSLTGVIRMLLTNPNIARVPDATESDRHQYTLVIANLKKYIAARVPLRDLGSDFLAERIRCRILCGHDASDDATDDALVGAIDVTSDLLMQTLQHTRDVTAWNSDFFVRMCRALAPDAVTTRLVGAVQSRLYTATTDTAELKELASEQQQVRDAWEEKHKDEDEETRADSDPPATNLIKMAARAELVAADLGAAMEALGQPRWRDDLETSLAVLGGVSVVAGAGDDYDHDAGVDLDGALEEMMRSREE